MADDMPNDVTQAPPTAETAPVDAPVGTVDTLPVDTPTADTPPVETPAEATLVAPAPTPDVAPVNTEPVSSPTPNVVEERPLPPAAPVEGPAEDSPQRQNIVIQKPDPRSFLAKAIEKIQFRKRAKLEKIMEFTTGKKEIANDQIEKLLHISDSTAQRYLIQLANEGKLRRIGKDGSSRYEPV